MVCTVCLSIFLWIWPLYLVSIISACRLPWASCQIRKIAGCACAGNAGNVFPRHRLQRKPLVSDPGMHHGTCVTHVPWCMSGSLTRGGGENVPGIPGACALAILRIWQEAHRSSLTVSVFGHYTTSIDCCKKLLQRQPNCGVCNDWYRKLLYCICSNI